MRVNRANHQNSERRARPENTTYLLNTLRTASANPIPVSQCVSTNARTVKRRAAANHGSSGGVGQRKPINSSMAVSAERAGTIDRTAARTLSPDPELHLVEGRRDSPSSGRRSARVQGPKIFF